MDILWQSNNYLSKNGNKNELTSIIIFLESLIYLKRNLNLSRLLHSYIVRYNGSETNND